MLEGCQGVTSGKVLERRGGDKWISAGGAWVCDKHTL